MGSEIKQGSCEVWSIFESIMNHINDSWIQKEYCCDSNNRIVHGYKSFTHSVIVNHFTFIDPSSFKIMMPSAFINQTILNENDSLFRSPHYCDISNRLPQSNPGKPQLVGNYACNTLKLFQYITWFKYENQLWSS